MKNNYEQERDIVVRIDQNLLMYKQDVINDREEKKNFDRNEIIVDADNV